MVRKLTAATAVLALLASCAPADKAPVKVRALVLSSNGKYVPQQVELKTIADMASLEGQVVKFVGGSQVRLDSNDPLQRQATTEEAYERAILRNPGRPVVANYIKADDGVLWPADFHSWNLVTSYYNFERAWDYFRTVGNVPAAELPQTTVHYFSEFVLADSGDAPKEDNALFFPPVRAFLVLPFKEIQQAPLAINAGVIAHEYSHLVFNQRVYGGKRLPDAISAWSDPISATPGLNLMKSLDEGLADYHAYVASCRTAYGCNTQVLKTSFEGKTVTDRDLTRDVCMGSALRAQLLNNNFNQFSGQEYAVGNILASALYRASQSSEAARTELARSLLLAYSDSSPNNPGLAEVARQHLSDQSDFTPAAAALALVRHITNPDLQQAVCNEFVDRLQIPREALIQPGACSAATSPGRTCI
jgi:hypothetical protein